MDEDEEEEDFEPGKLPEYPRAMLRFELSDGRSVMKGIEYKRLNGVKLGETALGTKVLLHRVPVKRGIRGFLSLPPLLFRTMLSLVMLAPENTKIMGGMIEPLETEQPERFVATIKQRLEAAGQPQSSRPRLPKPTRADGRVIRPPQSSTASNQPASRSSGAAARAAAIAGLDGADSSHPPKRQKEGPIVIDSDSDDGFVVPAPLFAASARTTTKSTRATQTTQTTQSTTRSATSSSASEAAARRRAAVMAALQSQQVKAQDAEYDFDEFDDADFEDVGFEEMDTYDNIDDLDLDESFLRQIDQVEALAAVSSAGSRAGSTSHSASGSATRASGSVRGLERGTDDLQSRLRNANANDNSQTNSHGNGNTRRADPSSSGRSSRPTRTPSAQEIIEISD